MKVSLLNEVFYSECIFCQRKIHSLEYICENCFSNEVKFVENYCSKCGNPLEVSSSFCKRCATNRYYGKLFVACWYEGIVREAIKDLKFNFSIKEKFFFEKILLTYFQNVQFNHYDLIIPVPVNIKRRFIRFVHLSESLAKIISKEFEIIYKSILQKKVNTDFQWKYKKRDRLKNVKNTIFCKEDVLGLNILLVDDIITTGATLNECASILKSKGAAKIDCFVLAKGHFI